MLEFILFPVRPLHSLASLRQAGSPGLGFGRPFRYRYAFTRPLAQSRQNHLWPIGKLDLHRDLAARFQGIFTDRVRKLRTPSIPSERSETGVPGDSFSSLGWGVEGPASCIFVKWVGNHEFDPAGIETMLGAPPTLHEF